MRRLRFRESKSLLPRQWHSQESRWVLSDSKATMPRCTSAQTLLASPQHTGLYHPHLQAPGSTIFPILGSPKLDHGSALVQNYSWKPHPYGGPTLDGVTSPKPTYILHSPLYMVIENAGMLGFTTRLLKLTQFPQAHSAQSPCPSPSAHLGEVQNASWPNSLTYWQRVIIFHLKFRAKVCTRHKREAYFQ